MQLINSFFSSTFTILDFAPPPPSQPFSIVCVQLLSLPWCPLQHRQEVAFPLPSSGTIDAWTPHLWHDLPNNDGTLTRHLKIKKCSFTGNDAEQHLYTFIYCNRELCYAYDIATSTSTTNNNNDNDVSNVNGDNNNHANSKDDLGK